MDEDNTTNMLLNPRDSNSMAFVEFNMSRSCWMWLNGTRHFSLLGL